jgi:hypothetical protein
MSPETATSSSHPGCELVGASPGHVWVSAFRSSKLRVPRAKPSSCLGSPASSVSDFRCVVQGTSRRSPQRRSCRLAFTDRNFKSHFRRSNRKIGLLGGAGQGRAAACSGVAIGSGRLQQPIRLQRTLRDLLDLPPRSRSTKRRRCWRTSPPG